MSEKEVLLKETVSGSKIIVVRQDLDIILNSAADPEYASEVFADGYQKELKEFDFVFIFGFSDGRALRKLIENVSDTIFFVIYEPDREIFKAARENFEIEDIISKKNVKIYLEKKDENNLEAIFHKHMNYYNCNKVRYVVLPNYNLLFKAELEIFLQKLLYVMNETLIQKKTTMTFELDWRKSAVAALQKFIDMQDIFGLKQEIQKYNIAEVPAIIVCAGPSLDKNIKELKRAEGKSLLIVVDAALPAASKHGIRPDLGINIDGQVPKRFFASSDLSQIPMVVCSQSSIMILEDDNIQKIYEGTCCGLTDNLETELLHRNNQKLSSGGSVSTDAFSLAVYLGFQTVIFVGQDLSYPEGKLHNEAVAISHEENKKFVQNIEPDRRVDVEDVSGNKVLTDIVMKWYIDWFEKTAREMPQVHIIDATEGGARIKSTEVMTLRDAIDRECKEQVDFKSLISRMPEKFTDNQKNIIIQKIKEEPERLREVQKELKAAISDYERLICLARSGQEKSQEFQKLYQKASEMVDFESREPAYKILYYYNLQQIYEEDADIYERDYTLVELLESARNMFQGYSQAIELYLEDFQKIVLDKS